MYVDVKYFMQFAVLLRFKAAPGQFFSGVSWANEKVMLEQHILYGHVCNGGGWRRWGKVYVQ